MLEHPAKHVPCNWDGKRDENNELEWLTVLKNAPAAGDEQQELEVRRFDLERRLREKGALVERQECEGEPIERMMPNKSSVGQAVKLASEFLSAVIVGVGLGLGFDQITGFFPWGLVVFLFLGFAAGVLNMLRAVGRVSSCRDGL